MKRHEIWTASGGGGYAGKPRPIIILQDDRLTVQSTTFCGITTNLVEAPDVRPVLLASHQNGLREDSAAMIDKIMTVPHSKLGRKIGELALEDSLAIDRALLLFFRLSP